MSKTYLPYDPDQQLLLPAGAPGVAASGDHLAYFISDVVDQMDLSAITARYERERRGGPPYHPTDDGQGAALRLLRRSGVLAGASPGALREDIAFRVLAANNTPDFRTDQSDFRKDHLEALAGSVPAGAGVVPAGRVW